MPGRIAGIATFTVDELPMSFTGGLEYQPNNTKREPIMGGDGNYIGYKETGEAPYMSLTMVDDGTFLLADLFKGEKQLFAKLANGKVVRGHSMMLMEPPAAKNDDGTFEAKWIGPTVTEELK